MRYQALHGSREGSFDRFDPSRMGSSSGYAHASQVVSFTSSFAVADQYAEGEGFVGLFSFELDNPLDIPDNERPMGIADFIRHARSEGHDGIILRGCAHTAISPGESSDIFLVFDSAKPRLIEIVREGPTRKPARKARSR